MADPSIITGVRNTGNLNSTFFRPDWERKLHLIEPGHTPFFENLFFSEKIASQVVTSKTGRFDIGEDQYVPALAAVTANFAGGAVTGTISVTVGQEVAFKKYDVIYLETSDTSARLTADPVAGSGQLVVSSLDGVTNLGAVNSGDNVISLGGMVNEYGGVPTSITTIPTNVFNYTSITTASVSSTGTEQSGESWTDGLEHRDQVKKTILWLKQQVELKLLLSPALARASVDNYYANQTKGVLGFINTNKQSYQGVLTKDIWDNFLQQVFTSKGATDTKTVYGGSQAIAEVTAVMDQKLTRLQKADDYIVKLGAKAVGYMSPFGFVNIVWDPMMIGKFSKYFIVVDEPSLKLRYQGPDLKGPRRFRVEPNVETPGYDGKVDKILMHVGIEVANEEKFGVLYRTA